MGLKSVKMYEKLQLSILCGILLSIPINSK